MSPLIPRVQVGEAALSRGGKLFARQIAEMRHARQEFVGVFELAALREL
jgi:hypothetical protein